MSDIPKGGWSIFKHEGEEFRVPTVLIHQLQQNTLESAVDRVLDAVTQRDHYVEGGVTIKDEYDCCGCSTYMKIVRDSISAIMKR
jgi:hypothetical protein